MQGLQNTPLSLSEMSPVDYSGTLSYLNNGKSPGIMRTTVNGGMIDISIKISCPVNLVNFLPQFQ